MHHSLTASSPLLSCCAGGPDEAARIAELEARSAELAQQAERLQRRSTPRPAPPQYLTLRDDVARFAASFGSVPRLLELIGQLRWAACPLLTASSQRMSLACSLHILHLCAWLISCSQLTPHEPPRPSSPAGCLCCSSDKPDEAAAGTTQVAVWQQNAAAWAERLGRQHTLYRDVVQVRAWL